MVKRGKWLLFSVGLVSGFVATAILKIKKVHKKDERNEDEKRSKILKTIEPLPQREIIRIEIEREIH